MSPFNHSWAQVQEMKLSHKTRWREGSELTSFIIYSMAKNVASELTNTWLNTFLVKNHENVQNTTIQLKMYSWIHTLPPNPGHKWVFIYRCNRKTNRLRSKLVQKWVNMNEPITTLRLKPSYLMFVPNWRISIFRARIISILWVLI